MRSIILIAGVFAFLASCSVPSVQIKEADIIERDMSLKESPSGQGVIPLQISEQSFHKIMEWYDEDTVLYLKHENGQHVINKYEIAKGKESEFYRSSHPIVNIVGNFNQSYFALLESTTNYHNKLLIVNGEGNKLFEMAFATNELHYTWSPYEPSKLLLISYLSPLTFEVYMLDIMTKHVEKLHVNNPYVQWFHKTGIAYLNWEGDHATSAPLHILDLHTLTVAKPLANKFITFFTFPNKMLGIEQKAGTILYSFFETPSLQKSSQFELPIINTYSEHLWLPEHDYVPVNETFYYAKPIVSDNNPNEANGFVLTKVDVTTGKSKEIVEIDSNSVINCSPDGKWCLHGNQLEFLADIKKQMNVPLIQPL